MSLSKAGKIEKVDFIVAGAQKCGTTALHFFLEKHSRIALPDKQELHFFDNDELFSGAVNYDLLHDSFRPGKRVVIAGENTPAYIYWKPSIERIWKYNQDMKLIIVLRDPIRRAFSHWNMQRERGFDALDFLDAVKEESQRLREVLPLQSRRFSYIDRGFYSEQIERVFQFFPRKQVHVIKFEDFRTDQPATMHAVFRFLALEPLPSLRNKERNMIPYSREITAKERQELSGIFREDIIKLETLLDWDCSDWKQPDLPA